jgi:hypothetical protein
MKMKRSKQGFPPVNQKKGDFTMIDKFKATFTHGVKVHVERADYDVDFTLEAQIGVPFDNNELAKTPGLFSLVGEAREKIDLGLFCPYKECTSTYTDQCKGCALEANFVILPTSGAVEKLSKLVRE